MFNGILHAHSGLRWIVLALLVTMLVNGLMKWKNGSAFSEKDRKIIVFTMISFHIQMTLGFILYFMSAKVQFNDSTMANSIIRFFTVEHIFGMLLAVILITVGKRKALSAEEDDEKFKKSFIFSLITLLIVLATIPWPMRNLGSGWF